MILKPPTLPQGKAMAAAIAVRIAATAAMVKPGNNRVAGESSQVLKSTMIEH